MPTGVISTGRSRRRGAIDPDIDPSVFDFLHGCCRASWWPKPRSGFSRTAVLRFAMKLQQYSGPVMAKGLEDTAFYRYNRLIALNEVGGDPDRFGIAAPPSTRPMRSAPSDWPHAMLGTSTHDTKRGEDTRARLAVLSEMPEEWARQVQTGAACCAPGVATSRAPRRPTATTNTCSTSFWLAPGRLSCWSRPRPGAARRDLRRADYRRAGEIDARGQAAFHLDFA